MMVQWRSQSRCYAAIMVRDGLAKIMEETMEETMTIAAPG
jgi:hypothetical protein